MVALPEHLGTDPGVCLLDIPVHRKRSLGCHPRMGRDGQTILALVLWLHLGSGLSEVVLVEVLGQEGALGVVGLLELEVGVVLEVVALGEALEEVVRCCWRLFLLFLCWP